MRCSAAARLCRQMLHFASLTEILSLRYRLSVFLSPQKEKLRKRKTAQGAAPLSEPRFAPADRDEIKSRGSMRLRPPRPPGERVRPVAAVTGVRCTAEKVSVFGQKVLVCEPRGTTLTLASPLRAAKQGRGNESVSGGDREPRLTEPRRDSPARRR